MASEHEPTSLDPLVALYPRALPQVYGYLLPRCGSTAVAEDLTADTFMAAVAALQAPAAPALTVGWLIGVARNKLVDHGRRAASDERKLAAIATEAAAAHAPGAVTDPWDDTLDAALVHAALARLPYPQRAALTLRYLDALPVGQVAAHLGRSVHATETLLVRARAALRRAYQEGEGRDS
ncbi:MAG TPA: sigma-70 family RNA polymerase sigma factor [Streptosporangiaceae bacterium]